MWVAWQRQSRLATSFCGGLYRAVGHLLLSFAIAHQADQHRTGKTYTRSGCPSELKHKPMVQRTVLQTSGAL